MSKFRFAGDAVSLLTAADAINEAKNGAEMVSAIGQFAATAGELATNPLFILLII